MNIPVIKQCPTTEFTKGKTVFCSNDGLHIYNAKGKELTQQDGGYKDPKCRSAHGSNNYLRLSDAYDHAYVHILVCTTFHGPRPRDKEGKPFECHHLNGKYQDNRPENLIWLSERDHDAFDRVLKQGTVLVHHDPHELSDREISRHCEF